MQVLLPTQKLENSLIKNLITVNKGKEVRKQVDLTSKILAAGNKFCHLKLLEEKSGRKIIPKEFEVKDVEFGIEGVKHNLVVPLQFTFVEDNRVE
jgi:hypothetical protein